jgi:hypothetical protein
MSNGEAVKQAEMNLKRVRSEADALAQQLINVVPLYANELANQFMKRAVTGEPEVTKSLGQAKLGELKNKFKGALAMIPSLSEQKLKSVQWAHREQLPSEHDYLAYYNRAETTCKSLEEAVRDLIGHIGALLLEYGYERDEKRVPLWQSRPGTTPRYSYGLPDDLSHAKEFRGLSAKYKKFISEEYQKVDGALNEAVRAKKAGEAQSLWDSV